MSSGDLLRNEVMSMTERGRKIYQLMSNGEQVPNSEVDQLLVEAMTSKKSTKVNSKWMIWKSILKFKRQFLVLVWCFSFFLCNILFLFVPSLWKPLKIACDLCGRKKLRTITVSLYITVFENHQKSLILQHCERSELKKSAVEFENFGKSKISKWDIFGHFHTLSFPSGLHGEVWAFHEFFSLNHVINFSPFHLAKGECCSKQVKGKKMFLEELSKKLTP